MAVPVADGAQVALDVANLRLSKQESLALKFLIGLQLRRPRKGVALSLPHVSAASVRVAVERAEAREARMARRSGRTERPREEVVELAGMTITAPRPRVARRPMGGRRRRRG